MVSSFDPSPLASLAANALVTIEAQVFYASLERDREGRVTRRCRLLPLERNTVTFFPS